MLRLLPFCLRSWTSEDFEEYVRSFLETAYIKSSWNPTENTWVCWCGILHQVMKQWYALHVFRYSYSFTYVLDSNVFLLPYMIHEQWTRSPNILYIKMYLRTLIWLLTTNGSMRHKISTNESTKEPSHRLALSPPHSKLYRITKKPEAPMAPKTNNQASQTNQRGNRPESTSSDSNQRSSRVLFCSHISCNNTVALLKYYIGGKFILPPMNFTNQGWCACKLIKRQSHFYITMTLTAMGSLRRRKISITSSVVG